METEQHIEFEDDMIEDENDAGELEPSSKDEAYGPVRKRRRKNRVKHNENEARRRSRLRDKFSELRSASHCDAKDRMTILTASIQRLKLLSQKVARLESGGSVKKSSKPTETESTPKRKLTIAPTTARTSAKAALQAEKEKSKAVSVSVAPPMINSKLEPAVSVSLVHSPALGNIAVGTMSLDGRFNECNAAFSRLTGFSESQGQITRGGVPLTLFALAHPADVGNMFGLLRRLLCGETSSLDADVRCSTLLSAGMGSPSAVSYEPCRLTITVVTDNGKPAHFICFVVPNNKTGTQAPLPILSQTQSQSQQETKLVAPQENSSSSSNNSSGAPSFQFNLPAYQPVPVQNGFPLLPSELQLPSLFMPLPLDAGLGSGSNSNNNSSSNATSTSMSTSKPNSRSSTPALEQMQMQSEASIGGLGNLNMSLSITPQSSPRVRARTDSTDSLGGMMQMQLPPSLTDSNNLLSPGLSMPFGQMHLQQQAQQQQVQQQTSSSVSSSRTLMDLTSSQPPSSFNFEMPNSTGFMSFQDVSAGLNPLEQAHIGIGPLF